MFLGSKEIRFLRWLRTAAVGAAFLAGCALALQVAAQETTARSALDALQRHSPLGEDEWLEEADGRQYYIARFSKTEGPYLVEDEGKRIRYQRFFVWDVVDEDDDFLYVKQYRPISPEETKVAQARQREQQEERLAEIAATYAFEDRRADRLRFESFDEGLPRAGQWRNGFDVADINNDGFLDIVHSTPRKVISPPVVFLGDGHGTWTQWEASFPEAPYDYGDVAVADVDQNGLLDIAMGFHLRGLMVLVQERPGHFRDASEGLPLSIPGAGGDASGFSSRSVKLADWNRDGRPDLLALGEGARPGTAGKHVRGVRVARSYGLAIFLNAGEAGWEAISEGSPGGVFGDSFVLGDFNQDHLVDVATETYNMGTREILHLNTGEGFEAAELPSLREFAWVFGITAGDFNEDGSEDLVTSFATRWEKISRRGLEYHHIGDAGEWVRSVVLSVEGTDNMWSLATGDLDADGHLDLVASTEQGRLWVYLGDGAGGFLREASPELDPPPTCRGYGLMLRDLDGDGRDEILAGFSGEGGDLLASLGRPEVCPSSGALRVWRSQPGGASRSETEAEP